MFYKRWTDSKFGSWIIKTFGGESSSGKAMTLEAWVEFHEENSKHLGVKICRFIDLVQHHVRLPIRKYNSLQSYLNNRFVTKSHVLHTGLEAGRWYDLDHRIYHGLTHSLEDFIAEECGWMQHSWQEGKSRKEWKKLSVQDRINKGLENLQWQSTLTNVEFCQNGETPTLTHQAISAKEILDIHQKILEIRDWDSNEEYTSFDDEERVEQLRTDVLVRIVQVRRSLWT